MDKEEFKRLERAENKAYKKRSKQALYDWGIQFEKQIIDKYERKFKEDMLESIDYFIIAIMFTLHFSETTRFGSKRLNNIMNDINATIEGFRTGEYKPDEYKQMLKDDGIILGEKE